MSQVSPSKNTLQPEYTHRLRSLMQPLGFFSFKALSLAANVSDWQIEQLRRGKAAQMRAEPLCKLSQALQISLAELLATFSELQLSELPPSNLDTSPSASSGETLATLAQLEQEYQRLQTQLMQQRENLQQEFRQSSLQILESWLLQFPTAAHAAQQNSQISATKLLPLLRPLEQLLRAWGVEAIAPVGTELPYDPHLHQLMAGTAQPGDLVKVRYTGYFQSGKLLYRAKVSLVKP